LQRGLDGRTASAFDDDHHVDAKDDALEYNSVKIFS